MLRKIFFFIKSLLLSSIIIGNVFAAEISIIPLKKPFLNEEAQSAKISQGILKPKPKPSKKIEETKTIIVKKDKKKINFLIPKSKPLVVKSEKSVVKTSQNTTVKKTMGLQKNLSKQWKKANGQLH